MQTVHLGAQKHLPVVRTEIHFNSHADTCSIDNHFVVVHDHNRPMNVFVYNSKRGSKSVCIVDVAIAYAELETGQVVIVLINDAIEIKGLNHHLLILTQHHETIVLINEVSKFLEPIFSETMHTIQLVNSFDITYPIIIYLELNEVTSYF